MAQHNQLGKKGEKLAVDFLLDKGYDIVVKTRSTSDFGDPQDFLKPKQIQRIVKAVDEYVLVNNLDVELRFDIIAIVKENKGFSIEHLENAFYHF